MERLAITQRRLHRLLERVIDEPFAAQVQEGAMSYVAIRGPS